ncbi:MAG TPA: putative metal-dependent hydrolase [Vicinamibacteria bacterium]|nr:putative metal-dependent hydrolase [Vicinamibacteria bacterium]
MTDEDLRYPIGPFEAPTEIAPEDRTRFIGELERLPAAMRAALAGLSDEQLETPYRPGGWTLRQVAHHVPDSHMNSYVRMRLALTEDAPTIRPYFEDRWARLPDSSRAPVSLSLDLLEALHGRWVFLLRGIGDDEWRRAFRHPERGLVTLEGNLALYAWHGRHHVAQIASLRERSGWR